MYKGNKFRIFMDTANIDELRDACSTGVVEAIATNPNKFKQAGKKYDEVFKEIRTFFDGPVALEALSTKADDIYSEAMRLHETYEKVVIKIPANKEGVTAISKLAPQGVLTNATLIFNPGQALAAGIAGSPYISPFIGRTCEAGSDGMRLFNDIRQVYDQLGIESVMIAGSVRTCYDAINVIKNGADAIALTYPVFCQLFHHEMTELGLRNFRKDYLGE